MAAGHSTGCLLELSGYHPSSPAAMVFVVITEAARGFSFLQARGNLVAAEEQALGRKRAGLEVWQRKHGILESSAFSCPESDLTTPGVPSDMPITSRG